MSQAPYVNGWSPVHRLGRGGQGEAWLFRSNEGQRAVLKRLNRVTTKDRARLTTEVSLLARVARPSVPALIGFDLDSPEPWFLMEYIDGPTLTERIESEGALGHHEAVAMTLTLLDTLEAIHALGGVHRDIKPSNIVLRDAQPASAVLIDFGLGAHPELAEVTSTGEHIGNRFLLLPEQKGVESDKRDERSDVTLVVGVLLFALTGHNPVVCEDEQGLKPHQRAHAREAINRIPLRVREGLLAVFGKGFNTHLGSRWQSARHLRDALAWVVDETDDAIGPKSQIPVNIVWTLHCYEGRLHSLYVNPTLDDLSGRREYEHFFQVDTTPSAIASLPQGVQAAIAVLWDDVRPQVLGWMVEDGPPRFKGTWDHVSRPWFRSGDPEPTARSFLHWNREYEMPVGGRKGTRVREIDIRVDSVSASALATIDRYSESLAEAAFERALERKRAYEADG